MFGGGWNYRCCGVVVHEELTLSVPFISSCFLSSSSVILYRPINIQLDCCYSLLFHPLFTFWDTAATFSLPLYHSSAPGDRLGPLGDGSFVFLVCIAEFTYFILENVKSELIQNFTDFYFAFSRFNM